MRRRSVPLGLALVAYVVALVQRPGDVVADTKVDLYLDPAAFLGKVLSVWSPTTDLGHVFASQYSGYAWPMAPWFVLGDWLGAPTWLVHRLWLGTLLALAAWGVVRLLDALATPQRGALHVAAGALYAINPYVTVYADRTSITLLAYAALPWLLLAVHRGVREPRGWRWPAAFALVLASSGGGVNAAVTAWLLVGPALLLIYERGWGGVGAGALRPYVLRLAGGTAIAQLWWVAPVVIGGMSAPNFLVFSEQPGTIWSTTSLTESLRLMGFWTSYVGVGYGGVLRPFQSSAPALLFLVPVVVAGLLTPALSLGGWILSRRWRYAPFFLLLTLAGLLIMGAGWPEGTPLRRVVTGAYYRVESLEVLRTTYKAGALTALGLSVLGGAAFRVAWTRWADRRWGRPAVGLAGVVLLVLAAWPLVTGRALERQLAFDVPPAYEQLAADLDRRSDDTRAYALPAQLFGYQRWGGTIDPILPSLTDHAVMTHWIVPFSDRRAADLQFGVDALIGQERLKPGQLRPLLDLLGVGDVVVAADGDRGRSGEAPAGDVLRLLRDTGGVPAGRPYGETVTARVGAGKLEGDVRAPRLQRTELATGGLVRLLPRGPLTVVDGGAGGVLAMAAFGLLDPAAPLAYAPDVDAAEIRRVAAAGGTIVISDTNRRRAFVASRPRGQLGPTLPADEGVSADGAMLDPWLGEPRSETIQELRGVRSITAPASPQVTQFPERRPFAALDGDPETAWLADRLLDPGRHRLTVRFDAPRDVGSLSLLPYSDSRAVVRAVRVDGRRYAVGGGWTTLRVGLRGVRSVTVAIDDVDKPQEASAGAGGIRELRIPGVRVQEALRPPVVAEEALRGSDAGARANLMYLLERTTADLPRLGQEEVGERGAALLRDAQDAERRLVRVIAPPAAREFALDAWGSLDPRLEDDQIDALMLGLDGADLRLGGPRSSSRYQGLGRLRASGAFDRGPREWIGQWIAGRPAWVSWRVPRARTVRALRLAPTRTVVRRPTRVRLVVDGRAGAAVDVGDDGRVALPAPVRGRAFRLEILAARFPAGTPGRVRQRRAVGIGEIEGSGMPRAATPQRGWAVDLPCGSANVRVGSRLVPLRGRVFRAALEDGEPVWLQSCGTVDVPAGRVEVVGGTSPVRIDALELATAPQAVLTAGDASPSAPTGSNAGAAPTSLSTGTGVAPSPAVARWAAPTGRVLEAGQQHSSSRDGVRLAVSAPSWLVLGQSYDRLWRASCDGRDLGEPRPMQGYANAWPVQRGCGAVRFWYAPQRAVTVAYAVSLAGCLVLLGVVLFGFVGRRRRASSLGVPGASADERASAASQPLAPVPAAAPLPLARAVTLAVAVAVPLAVAFGLRAGAVALPALTLVLWRGIADRVLAWVATVLLAVVVPVIYVAVRALADDQVVSGNSTAYAVDRIAAHWVALAALVALGVILVRTLVAARSRVRDDVSTARARAGRGRG